MRKLFLILTAVFLSCVLPVRAQNQSDSLRGVLSLNQCLRFAIHNEPALRQAALDEEIAEKDIQIRLADWFPQIFLGNTYQHYLKKPVSAFPNFTDPSAGSQYLATGVFNSNALGLTASQNIFSNSLRLSGSTARYYRQQARQNTEQVRINLVVGVSKAFYDLLLSKQQLLVLDEDIARLSRTRKDAQAQYTSGTSDRIDFDQSQIALNNSLSQRFSTAEQIKAKFTYLRQLMGYPAAANLELRYDSLRLVSEVAVDTPSRPDVQRRVEFRQLRTAVMLEELNYSYYKYNFLPSVSAFGNYNIINQNDHLAHLFDRSFPNSAIGLTFSMPLFQGNKRIQNMRRAALELRRSKWNETELEHGIETQYSRALATYRSYARQFQLSKENTEISRHVYKIVSLQYQQGIKPYLNLIQAETDLRTSELNYLNSLFELLGSRLDVQQALGTVNTQP